MALPLNARFINPNESVSCAEINDLQDQLRAFAAGRRRQYDVVVPAVCGSDPAWSWVFPYAQAGTLGEIYWIRLGLKSSTAVVSIAARVWRVGPGAITVSAHTRQGQVATITSSPSTGAWSTITLAVPLSNVSRIGIAAGAVGDRVIGVTATCLGMI